MSKPPASAGWFDAKGPVIEGRETEQSLRRGARVAHDDRDRPSPQLLGEADQRAQAGAVDECDVGEIEVNGPNAWRDRREQAATELPTASKVELAFQPHEDSGIDNDWFTDNEMR